MSNYIDDFLDTYSQAESPKSFFYWAALASISAVVRKNVFINKKIYLLYPNLYIMFVAKSGLRKGYPVKQAQKLVEQLQITKVISGRNSIQSIITELSKQWTLESGKILRDANAFITNDELDTLLVNDPEAQKILTTLYDSFYHVNWKNTLKKDGVETLKNLCVTMLTATNPEHLDNFLDKASVKGGFLGRTQIIYEDRKSKINPLIEEEDAVAINTDPLVEYLKAFSEIKGQFTFSKDAVKLYKDWYRDFYTRLDKDEITDDTGTAERAGDLVLKLAMLLSINELGGKLLITDRHIDRGINLFYDAAKSVKRITEGKGKSDISDKTRIVLAFLIRQKDFSSYKKQLLAAKYADLTVIELEQVIETLSEAGIVEVLLDQENGQLYKLADKYVKRMQEKSI